ncbi:MAG: Blue light- and temperature-regulated antirepressor YcgF [Pseudomonadota bacterium]|jgi:Sensors of blue-light using FAD
MVLLVERARHANQMHGITGQLVYYDHGFMQYLEGPAPALDDLWQLLQRDPRHYEVELLARYPLTRRRFPGSPMMFLGKAYYRDYQLSDFWPVQALDMEELQRRCLDWQQEEERIDRLADARTVA